MAWYTEANMANQHEIHHLGRELAELREYLYKATSWKRRILLGVLHGFGSAIGATLLAGFLIYLVYTFLLVPTGLDKWIQRVGESENDTWKACLFGNTAAR